MAGKVSSVTAIGFISSGLTAAIVPLALVSVVGVIIVVFVAYAALLAIAGGLFIELLSRQQSGTPPGWMQSYEAALVGYAYALIGHLLWLWLTSGLAAAATTGGTVGIDPQTIGEVFSLPVLRAVLSWLWPAIFIAAAVLCVKSQMYGGLFGYVRAALVCLLSLPLSLLLPMAILKGLDQRLAGIGGIDGMPEALLGLTVLLGLYAAIGGLLAGVVLYVSSRALNPAGPRSARRAYLTGFLALLAWGAVTSIVIFLLPVFDPYADAFAEMAKMDKPLAYLGNTRDCCRQRQEHSHFCRYRVCLPVVASWPPVGWDRIGTRSLLDQLRHWRDRCRRLVASRRISDVDAGHFYAVKPKSRIHAHASTIAPSRKLFPEGVPAMSNDDEPDMPRQPVFYIGCGSLVLAALIGYPLGASIGRTIWGYNAGPVAGTFGFLAMMLACGFVARQVQKGRLDTGMPSGPRIRLRTALGDWVVWACAVIGAAAMAVYGAGFAVEIGEQAASGAVGLGIIGLVVGFVLGLVIHAVRRMRVGAD